MKNNLLLSAIFVLISVYCTKAQTSNENKNSVFWEISGNGLEKPSYLFGTIHMIPKDDYEFTGEMKEKFENCEKLVLEIDVNIPMSEQIELAKKIILPKDTTIKDYMTEEQYSYFQSYLLDTLQIKQSKFEKVIKIKPLFSTALLLDEMIEDPVFFEKEFAKKAKKNKIDVIGLETLDFQMSLFDKYTVAEQVEMTFSENNTSFSLAEYNKLLEIYKSGDLEKLYEMTETDQSMGEDMGEFLTNRNLDWIPKIENIIKVQPAFIAVGAAHLPGEDGVISLLQKQGYTVTPINIE